MSRIFTTSSAVGSVLCLLQAACSGSLPSPIDGPTDGSSNDVTVSDGGKAPDATGDASADAPNDVTTDNAITPADGAPSDGTIVDAVSDAKTEGGLEASTPLKITAISTGTSHTCAIRSNGTVKCWGQNDEGQLGLGDTNTRGEKIADMGDALATVSLGTGRTAKAIATSWLFTCALLDDNTVKCWGDNTSGQLGQGDTNSRGDQPSEMGDALPAINLGTGRTAKAISTGSHSVCALLDNDTVKCWGSNSSGQLGQGDNVNNRGDQAGEMGDALAAISLGTGRTAKAIAADWSISCALLDNNTVKCWGRNSSGELGLGDTNNRGDNAFEMGDLLPTVNLGIGRTAKAISGGDGVTCALLDNDKVKCWGDSAKGQLGQGDTTTRGDAPLEMGDLLPTINLGTGRTVKAISGGDYFICAVLDDSTTKCWGDNSFGQLGLGDTANRGDATGEMGDTLAVVSLGTGRSTLAISAGRSSACALLDNGTAKCWGKNSNAQLGVGDKNARGDNAAEMGDALPIVDLGTK